MKHTISIFVLAALAALTMASAGAAPIPPIHDYIPPIVYDAPPIFDLRDSVQDVRAMTMARPLFMRPYKDAALHGEALRAADALDGAADGYLTYARDSGIPPIYPFADDLRRHASSLRFAAGAYGAARTIGAVLSALDSLEDTADAALDRLNGTFCLPPIII